MCTGNTYQPISKSTVISANLNASGLFDEFQDNEKSCELYKMSFVPSTRQLKKYFYDQ